MILGILAALVMPRFVSATDESRRTTLLDQLRICREQLAVYKAQHGEMWPGTTASVPAGDGALFKSHLTTYTDIDGNAQAGKDATHKFGPYLPSIPVNPISGMDTVKIDASADPLPTPDGTTGWIFQPATGRLSANLSTSDPNGKTYVSY